MPLLKKRKDAKSAAKSHQAKQETDNAVKDEDTFYYFAVNNFTAGTAPFFTRGDNVKQPVLSTTPPADRKLALILWRTILKFMGEIADLRHDMENSTHQPNLGSVMTRLYRMHGLDTDKTSIEPPLDGFVNTASDPSPKHLPTKPDGGTFRHLKATLTMHLAPKPRQTIFHSLPLEDTLITRLDMVHFIIGNGLLNPSQRDELYCILCKQLTDNPFKSSVTAGWLLFTLMASSFTPTKKVLHYVMQFVSTGPPIHAAKIKLLLEKTSQIGDRYQPPSYFEIESALTKTPLEVSVTLMDGSTHTLPAEGNTTAADLCQKLAHKLNIRNIFGFSIYIAMYGKVASLGGGSDHIMDAISQCEQIHRDRDGKEKDAPWRLFFRKEMFAPWEDVSTNDITTNLIYAQITRGLLLGEYVCQKEDDLSKLAAQQFYIDHESSEVSDEDVKLSLKSYIPRTKLEGKEDEWTETVFTHYKEMFSSQQPSRDKVKAIVVRHCRETLSTAFSRSYAVSLLEGIYNTVTTLTVNEKGIYIIGTEGRILEFITFAEISTITSDESGRHLMIVLLTGSAQKFLAFEATDIRTLVVSLIDGLLKRSTYAVTLQHNMKGELDYKQGDLLFLKLPGGKGALKEDTCEAKNLSRGNIKGTVFSHNVHVLPTRGRPSDDVMVLFR